MLIGRTESTLRETAASFIVEPEKTSVFACSVTDQVAIKHVAKEVGEWDVMILNAAHAITPATLKDAPLEEWWQGYEVRQNFPMIPSVSKVP